LDLVVLDTDVASLSYKNRLPESMAAALVRRTVCVTFVTVAEMARWADKQRWGTRKRTELISWLGNKPVLPYDAYLRHP
jgi:predicted nucleic acid-binding protein